MRQALLSTKPGMKASVVVRSTFTSRVKSSWGVVDVDSVNVVKSADAMPQMKPAPKESSGRTA